MNPCNAAGFSTSPLETARRRPTYQPVNKARWDAKARPGAVFPFLRYPALQSAIRRELKSVQPALPTLALFRCVRVYVCVCGRASVFCVVEGVRDRELSIAEESGLIAFGNNTKLIKLFL